jgi:hypothetical protein
MPNEEQGKQRTTDERIDAIAMNLELTSHDVGQNSRAIAENSRAIAENTRAIAALTKALEIDAENIRALARIAEAHEQRISDIEESH